MSKTIGVNQNGRPVGQHHPRAKLTDGEAALIREEYASGLWSYARLADKFEISKSTVRDIVVGRRRQDEPVEYRQARALDAKRRG